MLFQFANASMLPLLGETFGATKAAHGAILISALIIGPQVVVAVMAPSVGYLSEVRGRKPVLMVGFSLEVVRAVLFAFVTNTEAVIAIELLDGVTGSIFNVMTVLIITDLTAGTGRFNLVQGVIGALLAIAAALSTGLSGFLFQGFGRAAGFLAIAAIAAGATAAAWMLLPETKPQRYADH
jgi:MFS family permease